MVVDPLKEDLLEISNKFTDGRGFNVCFEASGIPAIARQLILLAERRRNYCLGCNLSAES